MSEEVKRLARRASAAFGALGLGVAVTVASLLSPAVQTVSAFTASGGQVQQRAIYMSNSTPNLASQTYLVTFKPAATTSLKAVVVDFCSSSPIIGDTSCGTPTAFTVGTPTVTFAGSSTVSGDPVTSTGLPGTWVASAANSGRTLELDASAGSGALSTSTQYSFAITTVHNPSTVGTFYARILTYSDDTPATSDFANYAPGTEGSTTLVDYGGFALSTANNINITAKVQETLTFCTSGSISTSHPTEDPLDGANIADGGGSSCAAATTPSLTLGHGTPVAVIDNSEIDAAFAFMQLSTNATNGAVVRMHSTNSCSSSSNNAGLSTNGGAKCDIGGIGAVSGSHNVAAPLVSAVPNTGSAAWGLYVGNGYATTGNTASTTNITADGNYHDGAHTTETNGLTPAVSDLYYGMDDSATGVTSTYGDTIASTGGAPCNTVNSHLVFAAIASLTTPAGIYQGGESLVATGTF